MANVYVAKMPLSRPRWPLTVPSLLNSTQPRPQARGRRPSMQFLLRPANGIILAVAALICEITGFGHNCTLTPLRTTDESFYSAERGSRIMPPLAPLQFDIQANFSTF